MTRTVNRRPAEVPVHSAKEYFFNHLKWNGFCSSKNILSVDQETFANCNNVYVDNNNLLVSRPPITKGKQYGISNIRNVWTFSNTIVLHHGGNDNYELTFVKDDNIYATIKCPEYVKLVFVEGKIFVFSESTFGFFDTKSLSYGNMYYDSADIKITEGTDPEQYIYIPNTFVSTNSIRAKDESKNELTKGETITFNYSRTSRIDFSELIGRKAVLQIAGNNYTIDNFVNGNDKVITQPIAVATSDIIKASVERGTFIAYNKTHNIISYSADGIVWQSLPMLSGVIGEPFITNDGASCVVFRSDGFYMYSLAADVNNAYSFVDDTGTRIWQKFDYGFTAGEHADDDFEPVAEFDTNDIYAFVVKSSIKTYFAISNPDTNGTVLQDVSSHNILEAGHITFTRFAGTGTKLAISYTEGPADNYGHNTFKVIVYHIGSSGIIDYRGKSVLTYDGQSLTDVNLNIPVKNTALKILWNAMDTDYNILLAGTVGTDIATADAYWLLSIVSNSVPTTLKASTIVEELPLRTPSTHYLISKRDNSILTDRYWYLNGVILPLLSFNLGAKPIINDASLINNIGKQIYSTDFSNNVPITTTLTAPKVNFKKFYNYAELSEHYLSSGQHLYISSDKRNDNREFLWYLPEINTQQFNYDITGLHVLSKEDVGIFFDNEIWYVTTVHANNIIMYQYTKSKLQVGILQDSTVITSYDGKYIIFGTDQGLVAMSYQDFIASTEQTLTYMSNNIQAEWTEFAKQPIKLFTHLYWIICYQTESNSIFVFDNRNGSWWPWSYNGDVTSISKLGKDIIILSHNELHELGNSLDYSDDGVAIDWHITSQLLHLSAINNYKHIMNITLNTVSDGSEPFTCALDVTNYRNVATDEKAQILEYTVDISRTYVKRLNFAKVNQFQYTLRNDSDNAYQLPLSLTSVIIKYGIKERVR